MTTSNSITEEKSPVEIPNKPLLKRKVVLSRIKRRILKHLWLVRGVLGVGIIVIIISGIVGFGLIFKDSSIGKYIGLTSNFLFTPEDTVQSFAGRTNILLLGKGGAGHEAPNLTDTIILVSIDNRTPDIFTLSIPRDIWMPAIRAKINSAYYWGNQKENTSGYDNGVGSGGLVLSKASVEEIVGIPVHYAVVMDFNGFKEAIDTVGGIEVEVKEGFRDDKFPIPGKEDDKCGDDPEFKCRYETIEFRKGRQTMDGETALKFVRSRHSEGDEGTDFAREERQQQIIRAFREKLTSREILTSPKTWLAIKSVAQKYTETDVTDEESAVILRYLFNARKNIESEVLPEEFLENPPLSERYDNQYVLIPRDDDPETPEHDWSRVHEWIRDKSGLVVQILD